MSEAAGRALRDALSAARGKHAEGPAGGEAAEVVELHPGRELAGQSVDFTVSPRDVDELSRCLAFLGERKLPVLVRGHGTRDDLGNAVRAVAGVLSTERLTGVLEFDAQDGVLHVQAGTPLAALSERVHASGWELPLDPPGARSSVGGAIAASATGPRRQRYGPPRRAILGLGVVLPSGERTRCGGRVVKNVTGYDMAKLYAGSLGSFGVIESAWLRLQPAPAESRSFVGMLTGRSQEDVSALGVAVARRPSVRVAALVSGEPARELGAPSAGETVLVVECAGDAAAVTADADWLAAETGVRVVAAEARLVGRLREQQGSGALRARLAVLPSDLSRAAATLRAAGLGLIVYPGPGLLYALGAEDESHVAAVEAAAREAGADLLFEVLPASLATERDVFGDPGPRAPLLRALKQRFDPSGILNPGRVQGRL